MSEATASLLLKRFPRELLAKAKAQAALNQQTLREWVMAAINDRLDGVQIRDKNRASSHARG